MPNEIPEIDAPDLLQKAQPMAGPTVRDRLTAIDAGQAGLTMEALSAIAGDATIRAVAAESKYRQTKQLCEQLDAYAEKLEAENASLKQRLAELERPAGSDAPPPD